MEWGNAGLQDFLELDSRLEQILPGSLQDGSYYAVLSAILHSASLREESHPVQADLNILPAFRMIRDHGDLPLTPETILDIYASMTPEKTAGWKKTNCYLENSRGFYVTESAEKTPQTMKTLCQEFSFLNRPQPEQFDEIFRFILAFICIHPFQDGNGRMSVLLLQFLLQKAGLKCAVYLPVDIIMNGVFMDRTCREIRRASGVFYGMKPLEYDRYIPFMKEMLGKSYQVMLAAAAMAQTRE